jgi:hypothetical protein
MNRNKNISELINLLEIQKNNVVEDSKKKWSKIKCNKGFIAQRRNNFRR